MNSEPASLSCPRCRRSAGPEARYCGECGYAIRARPDYADDLHRTIVEQVPVGIFSFDSSGRVRYWNRALEQQSGVPRREALGRILFDVLPHLQPYAHRIMGVVETALPLRLEQVTHGGAHDTQLTEAFWFGPILQEDGAAAVLAVMEDITQKVRVDDHLIRSERLAAIGELAAGVAHNFNNILAAIGGDAQLLKLVAEEENLPPHVAEAAQQICDETMRGGRVAHDLLSFARGAAPNIQALDVGEVARDAVRLIKNHPAARAVTIEVVLPPDLPQVDADANLLHQVFFNLMLNALQAMPDGGLLTISAETRGHEQEPGAGMVDLKFHDSGVGIPRDQIRRVFDPFFSRRARGSAGSGLGLPVSLAMVKSIGGDIQIASAEGIGTTVTVSLPLVERRSAARVGYRQGDRGRALVVDDDANVRRTLTTLLTRRGFEVVTASGGEEAVSRIEEQSEGRPFRLVLMELTLPKGDAVPAARRMQALRPDLPVIVLTGVTDPRQQQHALESGARFSFTKPPNFTDLMFVVERLSRPESSGDRTVGTPG